MGRHHIISLKSLAVFFLISIVYSVAAETQAISQEYGVLKSSVMKMRFPVKDAKKQSVKILVRDKLTGKKATFSLSQEPTKKWYEGSYNINFVGNKYDFPVLEYFPEQSKEKMFVFIEPTTNTSEVALFENQNEALSYSKTRDQDLAKSGKSLVELNRIKEKTSAKGQMSLEAMEAIKQAELIKAQEAMTGAEKQKRVQMAEDLIKQADAKYIRSQFKDAAVMYQKAAELDPSNDKIYYKYGVCLYKIDENAKSLSMLSMAEGGPQDRIEHNFYVALNKMKLKDFDRALEDFVDIRDENDKELSPTAAFLAGQIEFQQQKYPDAKKNFEFVLDNSKDPGMDREAEKKIEEIDRIETYLASTKEYLRYGLNLGFSYDGNVVNMSQNSAPTDVAGYRTMYGANMWYALHQSMGKELGLVLNYSDTYTSDKNFQANATLQSADPMVMGVSLPYKGSLMAFGKGFAWSLTPSYAATTMSAESSTRTKILDTTTLLFDFSFQPLQNWVSAYRVSLDQDYSSLVASTGDNDQSALRTTFGTTQTKIVDAKNSILFITDFSYAINNAIGKNNTYNKANLGFTYLWPTTFAATGIGKVDLTSLQYPQNANNRSDITVALTAGASKVLTPDLSLSTSLQYTNNGSNVAADVYDKFMALAMLSYTGKLSRK